jgi:hypothetical protein
LLLLLLLLLSSFRDGGRTQQTLLIHLKTDAKIAAEGMWEGGERNCCQKAKALILQY